MKKTFILGLLILPIIVYVIYTLRPTNLYIISLASLLIGIEIGICIHQFTKWRIALLTTCAITCLLILRFTQQLNLVNFLIVVGLVISIYYLIKESRI